MNTGSDSSIALETSDDRTPAVCRMAQVLIVLVATALHGIFLSQAKPLQSANDRSRWCTVWSLVERGTFQIDEIRQRPGWDTIDLVHVDDHFHSTKPPLLTALVAGVTWCVQRVTGWSLYEQTQSVTFVVLLLTNLLPFVVSLAVWIAILDQLSLRPWTRLFSLIIAAFGTLVTPFLMTLNNHTVATASMTIALYALLRILKADGNSRAGWSFALCGFMAAWTTVNELPAASFAAIAFVLAYRQSAKQTLTLWLPAAAVPVIALIVTNVIATGSWKPVYADYGTDKYRFVIDGVPSYWMEPHGVDRNLDSPLTYFLHCTIGHHGIFSLTPVALLAIIGWLTCFRLRDRALKILLVVGALTSAVVVAFYMTRTQNYNYGGVSCGLRWAIWLTPLWLIAAVPVLDRCAASIAARASAMVLLVVSMFSAWQPIENPWRQPWLFQWMESRGWIDYSDERPELPKPLWTWFASLPETSDLDPAWIEFEVAQQGLAPKYLRLTARPNSQETSGKRLQLEIKEIWADGTTPDRIRTLLIETDAFNEGGAPADVLRWTDPNVTAAQQQADLALIRGLPSKAPYSARVVRYLKTRLRPEALRCTQAAAAVSYAFKDTDVPLVYRCDTWLTNDVPFGVAQVEMHITQPGTGGVLFHERWVVRDCWPKVPPYK